MVVKKLSRVGWLTEAKDDDKELSQMGGAAAGPGSLLQRDVPFTIILVEYLVRCTAAIKAYLAQIISPEIKLSTEAIFYY